MRKWTTREIRYLEEHGHEGAEAVARKLGRSLVSVQHAASALGVSLRKRWRCPKCGRMTKRPLNASTGWCLACTKELRNREAAEEVRELEDEASRLARLDSERNRLYVRKSRAKKKLRNRQGNR